MESRENHLVEFLELWGVEFEVISRTIEGLIPKDGPDKAKAVLGDSSGSRVQRRGEMKRSETKTKDESEELGAPLGGLGALTSMSYTGFR